jgi:hypothetical protein
MVTCDVFPDVTGKTYSLDGESERIFSVINIAILSCRRPQIALKTLRLRLLEHGCILTTAPRLLKRTSTAAAHPPRGKPDSRPH